jgi:hypothetical protein
LPVIGVLSYLALRDALGLNVWVAGLAAVAFGLALSVVWNRVK